MIIYSTCIFFIYLLFIFGCPGSRCCIWAFSSCGKRGLFFIEVCGLLIVMVSSCCGPQASAIVVHGLSARQHVESSGPEMEPMLLCIGRGWGVFVTSGPPGESL